MDPSDLTIEILKDIRDEVRQTNLRIDETNIRLDKTNIRLDKTNEGVEAGLADVAHRIVESEIRTSTAIADLAGTVREMTSVLRAQHDLRPRVERCERDIAALQRRAGKE
jgi:predicted  nucleic acid-binding Zn-ribbon protein